MQVLFHGCHLLETLGWEIHDWFMLMWGWAGLFQPWYHVCFETPRHAWSMTRWHRHAGCCSPGQILGLVHWVQVGGSPDCPSAASQSNHTKLCPLQRRVRMHWIPCSMSMLVNLSPKYLYGSWTMACRNSLWVPCCCHQAFAEARSHDGIALSGGEHVLIWGSSVVVMLSQAAVCSMRLVLVLLAQAMVFVGELLSVFSHFCPVLNGSPVFIELPGWQAEEWLSLACMVSHGQLT